jgi:hypothetical protein
MKEEDGTGALAGPFLGFQLKPPTTDVFRKHWRSYVYLHYFRSSAWGTIN